MSSPVVGLQPSVLRWARESSGLSIPDVARSLKCDPVELSEWEAGVSGPTYAQLEHLAYSIYKRPLAAFFLPTPPPEPNLKEEFRTLPDTQIEQLSADTRYQLRLGRVFQLSLRELNDGVNPAPRNIFHACSTLDITDMHQAASAIRDYLGITLADQFSWTSNEEGLTTWRNAVEDAGVFVFKRAFKQKTISGFCLLDDEFPLIYLNNNTAKSRQIFSLFHELAHVLLRVSAISMFDESYVGLLPQFERDRERYCNALAAEILIPSDDFIGQIAVVRQVNDESVEWLADRYHVSREAILRRFLDRGLVEQAYYETKAKQWAQEAEEQTGTGGNYYATQATYLGQNYIRLVLGKHYQGKLSLEQVADYLGVRTKSVAGLEAHILRKAVPA